MKRFGLMAAFAFMFVSCSQKPIVVTYVQPPKVQQAKIAPKRVAPPHRVLTETTPKRRYIPRKIVYRGKITKNFYAFDDYARFRFQRDCDELLFREETLMEDIKRDALSVVDVLQDIQTNIRRYRCR